MRKSRKRISLNAEKRRRRWQRIKALVERDFPGTLVAISVKRPGIIYATRGRTSMTKFLRENWKNGQFALIGKTNKIGPSKESFVVQGARIVLAFILEPMA